METRRAEAAGSTRIWIAGWLVAYAAVPHAQATDDSGFYLNANAVRTVRTLEGTELDTGLIGTVASQGGASLSLASSATQHGDVTWSAGLGYRASAFFAVEASYLDLGQLTYRAAGTETLGSGTGPLSTALQVSSKGPALAVVGILPILEGLEVSLRAGAFDGQTATDYVNSDSVTTDSGRVSKTTTSLLAGAGVSYGFAGHWAVQLQYLHLNALRESLLDQRFNVDVAMAGLTFIF
jgi:opacity protein-like surface antigen